MRARRVAQVVAGAALLAGAFYGASWASGPASHASGVGYVERIIQGSGIVITGPQWSPTISATGGGGGGTGGGLTAPVANGSLATMANGTTKCRSTAGTGAPQDCTPTQELGVLGASTAGTSMLTAADAKTQAGLWGATLPVHGTIPDADTTINVSGGSQYGMATVTANRTVTFGVSGSPVSGAEVMRVDVTRSSAFTVTFKDDAGTNLVVCPASVPCSVVVKHDSTAGHFANPSLIRIQ